MWDFNEAVSANVDQLLNDAATMLQQGAVMDFGLAAHAALLKAMVELALRDHGADTKGQNRNEETPLDTEGTDMQCARVDAAMSVVSHTTNAPLQEQESLATEKLRCAGSFLPSCLCCSWLDLTACRAFFTRTCKVECRRQSCLLLYCYYYYCYA